MHSSFFLLSSLGVLSLIAGCDTPTKEAPSAAEDTGAADTAGEEDTGDAECTGIEDSDEDGLTDCEELELGTAAYLVDTDGDGFSDYREVVELGFSSENNNFKFNPLIADTPRVQVNITSPPSLALLYESSTGTELSHEVERSTGSSNTVTTGSESTNSHAIEYTQSVGGSVTVSASAGFPGGFSGSASATVSYETSVATSQETSFSWSEEQSQENSSGYAEAEALAASEGTTITGGVIAVTADVQNTSDIAFTLTGLAISAYMSTPGDATILSPVGTLSFDTTENTFPEFSYGPGQANGPLVFLNDGLDTATAEALLKDSTNLHVRVVAYELTDEDGRSFTHSQTDIMARTATIIVDYEGEDTLLDSERYQVATNVDRETLRITAWDAMTEILKLPYEMDDDRELLSVRDVENSDERNGYWTTLHVSTDGLVETVTVMSPDSEDYDFGSLELKSGDLLHLIYIEDIDRDGLGRRQEKAYGTDIDVADTDGDGLTDGEEVLTYKTSPLLADTDGDGLTDSEELGTYGSDPLLADTDSDGLSDGEEVSYETDLLAADSDSDGLLDGEEVLIYGTDPLDTDSDDDGLSDGEEVSYETDPTLADTDSDALTDGEEVLTYGTDPIDTDSDDDCLSDGEEVQGSESDPLEYQDGICTPVSDPSSSTHASRTVRFSNLEMNGTATTLYFAEPGEEIVLSADWSVASASSVYCPTCVVQYYLGIGGTFSNCFTSRLYGNNASSSGSLDETFSAPSTPGIYPITRSNSFDYSCTTVSHSDDMSKAAGLLVVMNPS